MSITLPPTVHERLARCGTRVRVSGLVPGADVLLSIVGPPPAGEAQYTHTATSSAHMFTVPPLTPGAAVRAGQDAGGGFTPWSPEVIVEDAVVPPTSGPGLPESVALCSHCVYVDGLVPGCKVEVLWGSDVVGQGTADRHGAQCVSVNLQPKKRRRRPNQLRARMYVCDVVGPDSATGLVPKLTLGKPVVGGPLYSCQRLVPITNLQRGVRVRVETDTGKKGWACACRTKGKVRVDAALEEGEQVHAQLYRDDGSCAATGQWSTPWKPVVPPDENIKPTVLESLIAGDQIIRVDNQIEDASLMIRIRADKNQPPEEAEEFGPRPAGEDLEIVLNAPLVAGNIVSVVQTLCKFAAESDPVTVLAPPPEVLAPVIIPPLYECGAAVQVSKVHPGALVRVYMDGIPIGLRWAGEAISVSVSLAPFLAAGGQVTARQWVGGVAGPESGPVPVLPFKDLYDPRILQPVARGDTEVWVSGVTPGARVTILSGGVTIGEADAAEPIVRVPVSPVKGSLQPKARLCWDVDFGAAVTPVTSPSAPGTFPKAGEEFRVYANWTVPDTMDGGAFETRIEGQLYFPADSSGKFHPDAKNLPLVIIAHGLWNQGVESYKGYDYLAKHLARWGMLVFSLNMDDVNAKNGSLTDPTFQYARAEIILHAIDALLADSRLTKRINRDRIGLIGHSMGGEGVVVAQALNEGEDRGYAIQGVVSIAPTRWRPEIILRETRYMQLLGSMDLLTEAMTGDDSAAHFSGFRIYDGAWRPKTHFWIYGARHNPFNRVWVATGDNIEVDWADMALAPHVHERIAKCLINAFFQDALLGVTAYAGYMHGTIFPRKLYGLPIHTQHSRDPRQVLDNFGDLDEQESLAAAGLDKTENSQGQAVSATGAGLGIFDDIEHVDLENSPHNTKGAQLSWEAPNVLYRSNTGGFSIIGLTWNFALRIGQFYEDAALNPVDQPVDLFVTLSDGANEPTVRLGAVAQVPYPDSAMNVLCPMRTVRLPIDAFKAANPSFNQNGIQSVTLRLIGRATGNILVDDLEFGS